MFYLKMAGGDEPPNFDYDAVAKTNVDPLALADTIAHLPSIVDSYNAQLDRYAHYSRIVGWTMVGVGAAGIAIAEATGLLLVSRGILSFKVLGLELSAGPAIMGAGGTAVASGNQVVNEVENGEAAAETSLGGVPPGAIGRSGNFTYRYGYEQGEAAALQGKELALGRYPTNVQYVRANPNPANSVTVDVPYGWSRTYNAGFVRGFMDSGGNIRFTSQLTYANFIQSLSLPNPPVFPIEMRQIYTIPGDPSSFFPF